MLSYSPGCAWSAASSSSSGWPAPRPATPPFQSGSTRETCCTARVDQSRVAAGRCTAATASSDRGVRTTLSGSTSHSGVRVVAAAERGDPDAPVGGHEGDAGLQPGRRRVEPVVAVGQLDGAAPGVRAELDLLVLVERRCPRRRSASTGRRPAGPRRCRGPSPAGPSSRTRPGLRPAPASREDTARTRSSSACLRPLGMRAPALSVEALRWRDVDVVVAPGQPDQQQGQGQEQHEAARPAGASGSACGIRRQGGLHRRTACRAVRRSGLPRRG